MNRQPLKTWQWLVIAAGVMLAMLGGCTHNSTADAQQDNAAGHLSTSKIDAANQANAAHFQAIGLEADAQRKIIADTPKLPDDPPFVAAALAKIDGHARAIQSHVAAATTQTAVIATETPKVEKNLDDLTEAVSRAVDEQRKRDEHQAAVLVGIAVAGLAFFAFERFTGFTFLVALAPAIAAGALAFCLFGYVLALIVGVLHVVMWAAVIAAGVGAVGYVILRHQKGGLPAWFRNVEARLPLTPMEKVP